MKTNRELYLEALNLMGKDLLETKQRQFLQRLIKKHTGTKSKPQAEGFSTTCTIIINHLNKATGKGFKATTAETKALIRARLNDGFSTSDFKKVIDVKTKQWLTGDKYPYLRPKTLFGTKFEGYLQESIMTPPSRGGNTTPAPTFSSNAYVPPEPTAEEKAEAKKWREEGEKLIAKHDRLDWLEFYQGLKLFKKEAYTMGLKHDIVRGLFIEHLRKKKENNKQ